MTQKHSLFRAALCCLLAAALIFACGCSEKIVNVKPEPPAVEPEPIPSTHPGYTGPDGYLAAECLPDGFIACGTGGRLDRISLDGECTPCDSGTTANLLGLYTEYGNTLVCGEGGTLLMSTDNARTFQQVDIDTEDTLTGAVMFHDTLFAAGENGIIYRRNVGGWEPVKMETNQNFIGLVATNFCIAAITAETDICYSPDGLNWSEQNFNEFYDGLYPEYVFTRLIGAGETFFVLGYGVETPNTPLIMYTADGETWMPKVMMKINGEYIDENQDLTVHDISFNIDQIVGVLDDGVALAITECATCNESIIIDGAKDLWATASLEEGVLLCGEDFFYQVMDSRQIRQDKIGADQAQIDVESYGALLIDVREADELAADGYIPGSIHVPLAEVEERLPELAPDTYTEIIFYCASGKRSQKATELAVTMGYTRVYNLGGLSDWPYEIVKD